MSHGYQNRRFCAVQAFCASKILAEGEFISPEHLNYPWVEPPAAAKSKKKRQPTVVSSFLECVDKKDAGAKPCVARVCGLLRLDFPFCNSNPQHLVMTDE